MPTIRVMHFGLGPVGAAIVKQIAARPGFKIVGGIDIDPAKVGRDLGDVVGLSRRIGVKISDKPARVLKSAKPDVVVLCTSSWITLCYNVEARNHRGERLAKRPKRKTLRPLRLCGEFQIRTLAWPGQTNLARGWRCSAQG